MTDPWRGIHIKFPSSLKVLEPIRTVVREAAILCVFPAAAVDEIVLAVQEACTNVIRHCYKGCEDKPIELRLTFRARELEICIIDYGTFVDPTRIRSRPLEQVRPGGLGVHLIHELMDRVRYERNDWGGTTLTLSKRLPAPAREPGPAEEQE